MKIILREDVEKLGRAGDIVKVKDGFGRNFLMPRGLALLASDDNLKKIEQEKSKKNQEALKELEKFKDLAKELAGISLTIPVEANEKEQLYGSITSLDISLALKEEGFSVDKDNIKLEQPIKDLGIYEVPVKIHREVETKIKIWIVKK